MKQPTINILTRYTLHATRFFIIIASIVLYIKGQTFAADQPHDASNANPTLRVYCNSCHSIHKAQGTGLTTYASNYNLCYSCHASGGIASTKRLDATMPAAPGISGTSHRWDASMPATSNPNNQYGLKATADLPVSGLRSRLGAYANVITCSVCHNQHGQAKTPWDPNAPASGNGRHFQRTANDLNQMCEDCHAYRKAATSGTDVRTYDGTKKSHPVVKNLNQYNAGTNPDGVANANQFVGAAPLEPIWLNTSQTIAPRYHQNATGDTNATNNIVLDSSGKIRCLSCHGVHYTDSDSVTTDGSP